MVLSYGIPNKLINKDKKQFAVFVPQHFSKQFFAHY
ncbi:hypothetical protein SAMN04488540_1401 [Ferrimonas sediminum]|uniref:Uncharacterized protein n=1 Tax=Ferrimonas sediminum TaxID=718193 RepID=A0A1G9BZ92_9GAMM|nr:hypothetical protein SAMN04488540_1401 [Ferrimonas sediminum]